MLAFIIPELIRLFDFCFINTFTVGEGPCHSICVDFRGQFAEVSSLILPLGPRAPRVISLDNKCFSPLSCPARLLTFILNEVIYAHSAK